MQRREDRKRNQIESEMAVNEEKLRHTRLIKDEFTDETEFEAEFMPVPGSIKYKDSWISRGIPYYIMLYRGGTTLGRKI